MNNNVTGEYSPQWSYSNIDAMPIKGYANFSIGHGSNSWNLADIASLGVTKLLPPTTFVGGLLQPWTQSPNTLLNKAKVDITSPAKNAANTLNAINPAKKFPIVDTSNCKELASVKANVQAEQIAVAGTQASGYKGALVNYLAYVNGLIAYNDCVAKKQQEDALAKIQQDAMAEQAALQVANANPLSNITSNIPSVGGVSGVTIALIVGGVVLIAIISAVVFHKPKAA